MIRKNFNYKIATVQEIVEHFKRSTRQSIYKTRKNWEEDTEMSSKIEEAYCQYKREVLEERLSKDSC